MQIQTINKIFFPNKPRKAIGDIGTGFVPIHRMTDNQLIDTSTVGWVYYSTHHSHSQRYKIAVYIQNKEGRLCRSSFNIHKLGCSKQRKPFFPNVMIKHRLFNRLSVFIQFVCVDESTGYFRRPFGFTVWTNRSFALLSTGPNITGTFVIIFLATVLTFYNMPFGHLSFLRIEFSHGESSYENSQFMKTGCSGRSDRTLNLYLRA